MRERGDLSRARSPAASQACCTRITLAGRAYGRVCLPSLELVRPARWARVSTPEPDARSKVAGLLNAASPGRGSSFRCTVEPAC